MKGKKVPQETKKTPIDHSMKETLQGLVVRSQSGFYTVDTETAGRLTCRLRGRLKKGPVLGDIIAVGDWVELSLLEEDTGIIEAILPRHHELIRLDPTPRGIYRQIILSNPDQVVIVFACSQPEPHLRMLDRFLVIAEKQKIPAIIVANKVDLVGLDHAKELFGHYKQLDYPVIYTSVRLKMGITELSQHLVRKVSALAGPSGVGKSSLLNQIQPGLGLSVMDVSLATSKGRHTTVVRELFPISGGGYVADTPGIKALALWDTQPEEIDGYFREIGSLVSGCQFSDCTHINEPGCAVRSAVTEGRIHPERYKSYVRLRYGDE
jgi:ribosome biogenesis GTPase